MILIARRRVRGTRQPVYGGCVRVVIVTDTHCIRLVNRMGLVMGSSTKEGGKEPLTGNL